MLKSAYSPTDSVRLLDSTTEKEGCISGNVSTALAPLMVTPHPMATAAAKLAAPLAKPAWKVLLFFAASGAQRGADFDVTENASEWHSARDAARAKAETFIMQMKVLVIYLI
jgi:hypothetical protein